MRDAFAALFTQTKLFIQLHSLDKRIDPLQFLVLALQKTVISLCGNFAFGLIEFLYDVSREERILIFILAVAQADKGIFNLFFLDIRFLRNFDWGGCFFALPLTLGVAEVVARFLPAVDFVCFLTFIIPPDKAGFGLQIGAKNFNHICSDVNSEKHNPGSIWMRAHKGGGQR